MRRVLAGLAVGAVAAIVPVAPAAATHTGGGCPHGVTANAHSRVPHHAHQAHMSIPYCPPIDAPRHAGAGTH